MARILAVAIFMLWSSWVTAADTMTYDQAKELFQPGALPDFWIGDVDGLADRYGKLKSGRVEQIAVSPGGRPLHVISFGDREDVARRANFNSAVGGQDLASYMDKDARQRPVIYFVGPVHGHEVEGLTGLVNLIEIMETGRDLRGKDQSVLQSLGRRCRLLILPCGNPDGVARFEPRAAHGMNHQVFQFWGMGTWIDNTIAYWPTSKRQHPRVGPEIGFLGCYFNEAGINPMHDEFLAPMSTEAPAILRVALREGPDLAVSLHSHQNRPALLRPAYLPLEQQEQVIRLAEQVYASYKERGLPYGSLFTASPEQGAIPASFNLVSALYHISGATSFTFECPHGINDEKACPVTFEEILDIQLGLYESMLRFALAGKEASAE